MALNLPPLAFAALASWMRHPGHPVTTIAAPVFSMFALFLSRIFEAMSDDPDFEYLIIDSTIVRAHQHAGGAKKGGLKIRPLDAPEAG